MERRKQRKPSQDNGIFQQQLEASCNAMSGNNCSICLGLFSDRDRRPRSLPCGLSFCSDTVLEHIRRRETFEAISITQFPINHDIEPVVSEVLSGCVKGNSMILTDSITSSKPISKRLQSQRTKAFAEVQDLSCQSSRLSKQLHLYLSQLNEWKGVHQYFTSLLDDLVRRINKEVARVQGAIGEEIKTKAMMEQTTDSLQAAVSRTEILETVEHAHLCCENMEEWLQATNESFPNTDLVIQSQELRQRYKVEPTRLSSPGKRKQELEEGSKMAVSQCQGEITMSLPVCLNEEDSDDDEVKENEVTIEDKCPNSSMTVQQKVVRALHSISNRLSGKAVQTQYNCETKGIQTQWEIEDVQTQPHYETKAIQTSIEESLTLNLKAEQVLDVKWHLRQLLKKNKICALQEDEMSGTKRYARISVDEKRRVLVHALIEEQIHPEDCPIIIKHDEILRHIGSRNRKAFIELGVDGRSLGRIIMSVIDEGKLTENFLSLCSGQKNGVSYYHSKIWGIAFRCEEWETLRLGDYEMNNGIGGKAVISGVDWEEESKRDIYKRSQFDAGTLLAYCDPLGVTVSQFFLNTKDTNSEFRIHSFGKVEEGLNVIREAADHNPDVTKVKIVDCGVVLSV